MWGKLWGISMAKLTVKAINAAKGPTTLVDGDGLQLNVSNVSSKRWIHRFMMNGKRRDMGLGPYPAVSLAEARLKRDSNKRLIADGIDPIEAARAAKLKLKQESQGNFEAATQQYIAAMESRWTNAKHRRQWINTLQTYASPVVGQLAVSKVDKNHILEILQPIWVEKAETASRVRQRLEAILNWSIAKGLRDGPNPASWKGNLEFLLPPSTNLKSAKHHAAPSKNEAQYLYCELRKRESLTAYAFQFLMLSACRTGEVTQAKWTEIDRENRVWTIPALRMKARVEHSVPLTEEMIAVLDKAAKYNETPYLFPGRGTRAGLSNNVFLQFLRKQFPEFSGTPHGIRSTFRDWAEEEGVYGHRTIETALAHELRSKVEKAYLRTKLLEQRRTLMNDWAAFLKGSIET